MEKWSEWLTISCAPKSEKEMDELCRECVLEIIRSFPYRRLRPKWETMTVQVVEQTLDKQYLSPYEIKMRKMKPFTVVIVRMDGERRKKRNGDQCAECAAGNAGDAQGDAAVSE